MITVAMTDRAIQLPMDSVIPFLSRAPKLWDTTMPAPVEIPTNNASSRFRMGMALPTAARALSPTYLPTMMESAVLYSCCATLPSSMGMENSMIRFQGEPTVISLAEKRLFRLKAKVHSLLISIFPPILPDIASKCNIVFWINEILVVCHLK